MLAFIKISVLALTLAAMLAGCGSDGGLFPTAPDATKVEQSTDCGTTSTTGGSGSEEGLEAGATAAGRCVTTTKIGQEAK